MEKGIEKKKGKIKETNVRAYIKEWLKQCEMILYNNNNKKEESNNNNNDDNNKL